MTEVNSQEQYKVEEKFADFDQALYENFKEELQLHPMKFSSEESRIIKGKILEINKKRDIVIVDLKLKAEGVVGYKEFYEGGEETMLSIGDEYEFYIESFETRDAVLKVSRDKVTREKSWKKLKEAFVKDESAEGIIFARIKGGLCVDFDGIIAFLPGSQIDIRMLSDVSPLLGVKQPFKVLSMDEKFKSLIVSRRSVLESMRSGNKTEFLDNIKEGDVLQGMVKNITNYGAFIDLDKMDGLLHIADITWDRIVHPSEILKTGDKVKVKVIKVDYETQRISLGMKQLTENPWSYLEEKYKVGITVNGKVTNITDYGIFLEIEKNVEGLVHVSEISWTKEGYNDVVAKIKVGDNISAYVVNVDTNSHRIALSLKQMLSNPWKDFIDTHKAGQKLEGEITNIMNFGAFIALEGNVNGLLHVSDISWSSSGETELSQMKVGEKISVVYLGGDLEKQRIALGLKQMSESSFKKHKDVLKVGSVVTCTITAIDSTKVDVTVLDLFKTSIRKSHIAYDKSEQRTNRFAIGDKVDAKVIAFDEETGNIQVSIREYEEDEKKRLLDKYGSADSGATLASIFGDNNENN
jgi:small subunit ribosomal protein S1